MSLPQRSVAVSDVDGRAAPDTVAGDVGEGRGVAVEGHIPSRCDPQALRITATAVWRSSTQVAPPRDRGGGGCRSVRHHSDSKAVASFCCAGDCASPLPHARHCQEARVRLDSVSLPETGPRMMPALAVSGGRGPCRVGAPQCCQPALESVTAGQRRSRRPPPTLTRPQPPRWTPQGGEGGRRTHRRAAPVPQEHIDRHAITAHAPPLQRSERDTQGGPAGTRIWHERRSAPSTQPPPVRW